MESVERSVAIEELLQGYVQSPSEQRVSVFVKRTAEYDLAALKTACVRYQESVDRSPTVARLRQVCAEVTNERRIEAARDEEHHGDWIELLMRMPVLFKTRDGTIIREHIPATFFDGWRKWCEERLKDGWTEHECALIVRCERPRDWTPPRLRARA